MGSSIVVLGGLLQLARVAPCVDRRPCGAHVPSRTHPNATAPAGELEAALREERDERDTFQSLPFHYAQIATLLLSLCVAH